MRNYLNTNSKLKKDNIFKFSLPVKKTCLGAQACLEFCYATKGSYKTYAKSIAPAHDRNYEFSKSKTFVSSMLSELNRRKIKIVRLHDSGDFYSQEYLDKWVTIALYNPKIRFYAYTKSLSLDFKEFTRLPNTKIIQSFGGKYDRKINMLRPHARIFRNINDLLANDFIDCSNSDLVALETTRNKIGLVAH